MNNLLDEFEKKIEEVISDFPNLSYEDIADSLEWLSQEYRHKIRD